MKASVKKHVLRGLLREDSHFNQFMDVVNTLCLPDCLSVWLSVYLSHCFFSSLSLSLSLSFSLSVCLSLSLALTLALALVLFQFFSLLYAQRVNSKSREENMILEIFFSFSVGSRDYCLFVFVCVGVFVCVWVCVCGVSMFLLYLAM